MTTERAEPKRAGRPPLRRPRERRWVAGVAAGLAEHLCVPAAGVRVVLVGLAVFGGVGLVAYALLWALVPAAGPQPARSGRGRPRWVGNAETTGELLWGVGLLVLGVSLLGQHLGLPVEATTVLPVALAVAGAVVVWSQLDATDRDRWLLLVGGGSRTGLARLAAGVALAVTGILLLVVGGSDPAALRSGVVASVTVLAGVALLLAPWAVRLWRDLVAERAAREREAERAEVAAHLHDSVLQTLALIQRRSGEPAEVTRLARAQERELRAWLYGENGSGAAGQGRGEGRGAGPGSMAQAVRRHLAELEDEHGVPIELVTVGDRAWDRRCEALVMALREATLNAVRHGRPPVQVYIEAGEASVEAFVRDRGDGFDLDDVPPDRLGVRESVLGRMERAGGTASVRRAPGGGTEVALRIGPAGADGDADRPASSGEDVR